MFILCPEFVYIYYYAYYETLNPSDILNPKKCYVFLDNDIFCTQHCYYSALHISTIQLRSIMILIQSDTKLYRCSLQ